MEGQPLAWGGDRRLLGIVVRSVQSKGYPELEKLAYSTYPVCTAERHAVLDLAALAAEYEAVKLSLLPGRDRQ